MQPYSLKEIDSMSKYKLKKLEEDIEDELYALEGYLNYIKDAIEKKNIENRKKK